MGARSAIYLIVVTNLLVIIGCGGREAEFNELEKAQSPQVEVESVDTLKSANTEFSVEQKQAKADILFIVDNSGSMAYEHENMAMRFRDMINQIGAIDWQIAITDTDATGLFSTNGRLLSFANGERILTSQMNPDTAESLFQDAVQMNLTGDNTEQGLTSLVRAIDRIGNSNSNRQFFRDDSHLAVVIVSDEDESSDFFTGRTTPSEVLNKVDRQWNGQKSFMFHSIITKPNDQLCLDQNGFSFGELYSQLSLATGGEIGSVCENDYAKQLTDIGKKVLSSSLTVVELQCEPVDQDGDGVVDILINGAPVAPDSVVLDGSSLSFVDSLDSGDYELTYDCQSQ